MKIYSLNIGVSHVDVNHYGNALIPLPCCTSDAKYMNGFAKLFGYDQSILLTNENATVASVKNKIIEFSKIAQKGDLVIITYSGHGAEAPDMNGDEPINIGVDQTWCLYDRQIIDDEFRHLWKKFNGGVNILLILDSCHSGTAYKAIEQYNKKDVSIDYLKKVKSVKSNEAFKIFIRNKDLYQPICRHPLVKEDEINCYVTGISACQDEEEALAGTFVSFFTRLLVNTLATKHHEISNYDDFVERIAVQSMALENITPNISHFGKPTDFFARNKPFLKTSEEYPEEITSIYSDLIFGNKSIINEGSQDNGLLLEVLNDPDEKFINFSRRNKLKNIKESNNTYLISDSKLNKSVSHPWDKAYELYDELINEGISAYVEPDIIPFDENKSKGSRNVERGNDYLKAWPKPVDNDNIFTWHLDEDHSQLSSALTHLTEKLPEDKLKIKIGHIDTGYSPNHPAIPKKIQEGISFVDGEIGRPAYEKPTSNLVEQEDHGTATVSILAGKEVPETLAYGTGSRILGAIPFATVYPMRISETVALTSLLGNSMPFVQAVEKAIEEGCEVITMSMGGLPIRAWAKIINKAYEAGITIISAAGNSWVKGFARISPKKIVYPARFDRVIGVTGVCFNQYPYIAKANPDFSMSEATDGEYMQGNYFPESAMKTAIAAYTPNVPWAIFFDKEKKQPVILKNGAGTSSATPQVAAAAAMWIVKNKQKLIDKGYRGTWRQVEAVKYALFNSAQKNNIIGWEKYYGNGILKAKAALDLTVPNENQLKKAPEAKVTLGAFEFIKLFLLRKSEVLTSEKFDQYKAEMIFQEILQVLEQDPNLINLYGDYDLIEMEKKEAISEEQFKEICKQVALSPYSSEYLKSILF